MKLVLFAFSVILCSCDNRSGHTSDTASSISGDDRMSLNSVPIRVQNAAAWRQDSNAKYITIGDDVKIVVEISGEFIKEINILPSPIAKGVMYQKIHFDNQGNASGVRMQKMVNGQKGEGIEYLFDPRHPRCQVFKAIQDNPTIGGSIFLGEYIHKQ